MKTRLTLGHCARVQIATGASFVLKVTIFKVFKAIKNVIDSLDPCAL